MKAIIGILILAAACGAQQPVQNPQQKGCRFECYTTAQPPLDAHCNHVDAIGGGILNTSERPSETRWILNECIYVYIYLACWMVGLWCIKAGSLRTGKVPFGLFQIFSGIAIAVAGIGFAVHAVVLFWRGIIFE